MNKEQTNDDILDLLEEQEDDLSNNDVSQPVEKDLIEKETTSEEYLKSVEISVSDKTQEQIEKEIEKKKEENGVKQDANGRTLTVKSIKIIPPKTYSIDPDTKQKIPIKPKQSVKNPEVKYYTTKAEIKFKQDNIVDYIPSVNVFINNSQLNSEVSIHREGNTKLSQLFRLFLQHKFKNKFRIIEKKINEKIVQVVHPDDKQIFDACSKITSDRDFFDYMKEKDVLIETSYGIYEGRDWFRNDIKKII